MTAMVKTEIFSVISWLSNHNEDEKFIHLYCILLINILIRGNS